MAVIKKAMITLLLILLIGIAFTKITFATDTGVALKNAKLKKTVEESSITLEIIPKGDEFEILEEEGEWYRVNYKKIKGYVKKELVEVTKQETSDQDKNNTKEQSQDTNENKIQSAEVTNTVTGNIEEPVTNTVGDTQGSSESMPTSAPVQENLQEGSTAYIVSEVGLSVRPLVNSMKIETIAKDQSVEVISIANNWVYVLVNGKTGWFRKEVLTTQAVVQTVAPVEETLNVSEEQPKQEETKAVNKKAYVSADGLNIRKEASTESSIVDTLGKNAEVTIVSEDGIWCKITYKNIEGYAPKKYLSDEKVAVTSRSSVERTTETVKAPEQPVEETKATVEETTKSTTSSSSDKGSQVVEYAKQYLGSRYVYGGSSPSGFDCSGFVMYVYKQFGVSLPHSSSSQSSKGTKVEKANLKPGDIVFFTGSSSNKGIGHCGIYIGNNQFIHASTEKTGVIISSLNTASYQKRYVTARRIF